MRVEVIAGAKKEFVTRTGPDSFVVSVREKAQRNMANRRVLELVRREFGGGRVAAKIVGGHRSPHKIISIEKPSRQ